MQNFSIWQAILDASLIVQLVLVVLVVLMITSWALFFYLRKLYLQAELADGEFQSIFNKEATSIQGLERLFQIPNTNHASSGLNHVFKEMYGSLVKFNDQLVNAQKGDIFHNLQLLDANYLERSLLKSKEEFVLEIDRYRYLLAVIANLSPFIGLFGTVWGIVHSFAALSQGGGSIELIAPGIAEALVATAIGIGTSIPASWFYNIYTAKLSRFKTKLQNFGLEIVNLISRLVTTYPNSNNR
jgi:biopolymer transport protein TolQ